MNSVRNKRTLYIANIGLIIAILGVLQVSGLGFILIPPASITTMHLPVIVAGIILGPLAGAITGGAFGVLAIINASLRAVSPVDIAFSPFLSGSPISSIVMALGVRILMGFLAGYISKALYKTKLNISVSIAISAFLATLVHTSGVMLCLVFLFPNLQIGLKGLIATILSLNFIIEASLAVIFGLAFAKVVPYINSRVLSKRK